MRAVKAILLVAYAFLFVGGVVNRVLFHGLYAPVWAAPVFLVLAGANACVAVGEARAPLIFATGGALIELVGVNTGWPFGQYQYTMALGPLVAGVPLVIVCSWLVMLSFSRDLAWRAFHRSWPAALCGAGIMTACDLLIDPVSANVLHYWRWLQPGAFFGVPISNFAGWFGVSLVLLALAGKPPMSSFKIPGLGLSILAFFAVAAESSR